MTTQKQRILDDLRHGYKFMDAYFSGHIDQVDGRLVVCASKWLEDHMPRYAARIHELRTEGHNITTGWCKTHKTATYRLADDE